MEEIMKEFSKRIEAAQMQCAKEAIKTITGDDLVLEQNGKDLTIFLMPGDNEKYAISWKGQPLGWVETKFPKFTLGDCSTSNFNFSVRGYIRFIPKPIEAQIICTKHCITNCSLCYPHIEKPYL